MASLWCVLLSKRSIYILKNDRWTLLRWANFKLKCLLIIFILTSIQNSRPFAQTRTLHAGVSKLISKKKYKICIIYIAILLSSHQNTVTNLPFYHSSPINTKYRVCQWQVCYLHTAHLGGLNSVVVNHFNVDFQLYKCLWQINYQRLHLRYPKYSGKSLTCSSWQLVF